jgi:hypothetical protein
MTLKGINLVAATIKIAAMQGSGIYTKAGMKIKVIRSTTTALIN